MASILKKILSFVLSPKLLFIYIILVLIIIVKVFLSYELKRPSTSDAQVDGEVILIASQISGQIAKLNVKNNQYVKKGDILFILEPSDYELQVQISENNLELEKINFEEKSVSLKSLEEKLRKKEKAYKRAKTKLNDNKLQNSSTRLNVERLQESFLKARSDFTQQRTRLESKLIIAQKKLDEALI